MIEVVEKVIPFNTGSDGNIMLANMKSMGIDM